MSWISGILGGTTTGLVTGVAGAINQFVETGEEKKAAALLVAKMKQNPSRWQAEINKIEAGHRSLFVAGARPFILWVCGLGLSFAFIINPLLQWATSIPGPELPVDIMMELTLGMLGLAGLRTYEKLKGLTS